MGYTPREQLADPQNHGAARKAEQIKYLVIHYTGNDGDTARANAEYYHNTVVKASAHYFVDDTEVWRSVPDLTIAWAVGGKKWADCAKTGGGSSTGPSTTTTPSAWSCAIPERTASTGPPG